MAHGHSTCCILDPALLDGDGQPARAGHFGLPSMRQRMRRVGGDVRLSSGTPGTRVVLWAPAGRAYAKGRRASEPR